MAVGIGGENALPGTRLPVAENDKGQSLTLAERRVDNLPECDALNEGPRSS